MEIYDKLYREPNGDLRLGDKIKFLMENRNWELLTFASKCDLTYLRASGIIRNNLPDPTLYELRNIARQLEVDVCELLRETEWS